jgi:hypothetical protein
MKQTLIRLRRVFLIWGIVAILVWVAAFLYFKPWSPELGVPGAPKRVLLAQIMDFWVLKLPWVLWGFSYTAGKNKWLAPRGRYQEGVDYPVFSPYVYTAIALMAALFAASGILYHQVFDLPAGPAAIGSIFFNPIIAFGTLWIGGTLRAILFGQGEPVSWFLTTGLSDGAKNVWLSILYWNFRESKWGKSIWARAALWTVMHFTLMPATLMLMIVWYLPSNLWAMQASQLWLVQAPTGITAGLAGLFASEALISYLERRRPPVAPTIS